MTQSKHGTRICETLKLRLVSQLCFHLSKLNWHSWLSSRHCPRASSRAGGEIRFVVFMVAVRRRASEWVRVQGCEPLFIFNGLLRSFTKKCKWLFKADHLGPPPLSQNPFSRRERLPRNLLLLVHWPLLRQKRCVLRINGWWNPLGCEAFAEQCSTLLTIFRDWRWSFEQF